MREILTRRFPSLLKTTVGVAILCVTVTSVNAQLLDQLKGAAGSGQGGSSDGVLGGLGGGMPSVGQASSSNTAGVLQYCIKNNYLGGNSGASSVKDTLLSKVTGSSGQGSSDPGYKAGSNGLLQTGHGQDFSLGGGGAKAQITQKVCDQVLAHGKSLL